MAALSLSVHCQGPRSHYQFIISTDNERNFIDNERNFVENEHIFIEGTYTIIFVMPPSNRNINSADKHLIYNLETHLCYRPTFLWNNSPDTLTLN